MLRFILSDGDTQQNVRPCALLVCAALCDVPDKSEKSVRNTEIRALDFENHAKSRKYIASFLLKNVSKARSTLFFWSLSSGSYLKYIHVGT